MNKGMILLKKLTALLSILLISLLSLNVVASEITGVVISDFDNSVVTVSGISEDKAVTITVLPEKSSLSGGDYYTEDDISIQKADVVDGKFSASFKFTGSSGWYDFYVSGNQIPYTYENISRGDVLKFVEDLGDKAYSGNTLAEKLRYFAPTMGIDLAFAEDDETMKLVTEAIVSGSELIKEKGISVVGDIVNRVKSEIDFLGSLANAESAPVVNKLLSDYSVSAQIDITEYNKLSEYGKTVVCMAFAGKSYGSAADFRADFAEAVANAPESAPEDDDEDSFRPSSGGGGGGGRAPSVVITDEPAMEPEAEDGTVIFERFDDIKDVPWAWEAILYLSDRNIINGVGDNRFLPSDGITREQFAKIIAEAFECVDDSAVSDFDDVASDSWASKYIASVSKNGYMKGVDGANFGYGRSITRQDICVTIYRAALLSGYQFDTKKTDFTDFGDVSDYAADAVAYLAGEGILSGTGDGSFKPLDTATRAQAAKIIHAVMANLLKK